MKPATFILSVASVLFLPVAITKASTILGTGTAALIGGDLTDPENNGDPENNINYDATFSSSEEPAFGGAEAAFNVFDNQVGGGNAKWCCGDGNNFPVNPISITATLPVARVLTHFTITSGNDTPTRDPRVWQVQGSNDGSNWITIFSQNDPNNSVWTARDQVIRFDSGTDFALPAAYTNIRFLTTATGATTGARFQLGEIEYFSVPEPASAMMGLAGFTVFGLRRRRRV